MSASWGSHPVDSIASQNRANTQRLTGQTLDPIGDISYSEYNKQSWSAPHMVPNVVWCAVFCSQNVSEPITVSRLVHCAQLDLVLVVGGSMRATCLGLKPRKAAVMLDLPEFTALKMSL